MIHSSIRHPLLRMFLHVQLECVWRALPLQAAGHQRADIITTQSTDTRVLLSASRSRLGGGSWNCVTVLTLVRAYLNAPRLGDRVNCHAWLNTRVWQTDQDSRVPPGWKTSMAGCRLVRLSP